MKKSIVLLASLLMSTFSFAALAQEYPSKPITIIVPFPPGSGLDTVARTLAPLMSQQLGQSVIVENKAGGSGIIGTEAAKNAAPDGYTVLFASYQQFTAFPQARETPYTIKDFVPVHSIGRSPVMVIGRSELPFNDTRGLIEYAKANPGKLKVSTSGPQSAADIDGKLIASLAGIQVVFIPYQGTGPAIIAQLGGEVDISIAAPIAARQHVQAGTLKWLGSQGPERFEYLPDVPTLAEQGVNSIDESRLLMLAPKGTPPAVVAKLDDLLEKAVKTDTLKSVLASSMISASSYNSADTATQLQAEYDFWTAQLKIVGMLK